MSRPTDAQVWELRQQGLSHQEIADQTGLTLKQINHAIYRENKRRQPVEEMDLTAAILKDLGKERTRAELQDKYRITDRVLAAILDDLRDGGYLIAEIGDTLKIQKDIVPQENEYEEHWTGDKIIRFGAVSDTHLCSKWQQLTHLNTLYDIFQREGIRTVYHAGDITEGYHMRKGHEYEVFKHGADEQVAYVIQNYPSREGIKTRFITGNHDHSHVKAAGYDIGIRIKMERPDMEYLGMANARINLTPNCVLELNHALDGSAYALSYAIQKRIEAMSGGEKPNILLDGHHHKMLQVFYRNVHAFECGTTQAQTAWMRGKRLPAHLGGWIICAHVNDEGTITRCIGEWIPFYRAIPNDY
jgi:predicted phosphodiesterase